MSIFMKELPEVNRVKPESNIVDFGNSLCYNLDIGGIRMNFERLKKNLCDNILEAQIKLGYEGRPMSFNYILSSLNHLLGVERTESKMEADLKEFADFVRNDLGKVEFRPIKSGFCITVPEQGTKYVHENPEGGEFLREFIEAVRRHCTLDEAFAIFRRYSENVVTEEVHNDEFNYLVYFADGIPDDYRYCIAVEEEIDGSVHITYHRFIAEDYEDFGF